MHQTTKELLAAISKANDNELFTVSECWYAVSPFILKWRHAGKPDLEEVEVELDTVKGWGGAKQVGTCTGRVSGTKPNMANAPKSEPVGGDPCPRCEKYLLHEAAGCVRCKKCGWFYTVRKEPKPKAGDMCPMCKDSSLAEVEGTLMCLGCSNFFAE